MISAGCLKDTMKQHHSTLSCMYNNQLSTGMQYEKLGLRQRRGAKKLKGGLLEGDWGEVRRNGPESRVKRGKMQV